MQINILCFGITKEILGSSKLQHSLNDGISLLDFLNEIKQKHPKLEELKSLRIAVNEEYEEDNYIIKNGDEVVLIPPVSGG